MWLIGFGISKACAGLVCATVATWVTVSCGNCADPASGSGGRALDMAPSDDFALVMCGLTSSRDDFLTSARGHGVRVGVSLTTSGFESS